jgi:hypothetical protein
VWRLPRERTEKSDVSQSESAPREQPNRSQQIIPPPVPPPAAPAFEVHEGLPVEVQQPPITKRPVEAYAAPKAFGVTKRADFKMNLATLLASKSSLRDAILLREILGQPRGLRALDLL